MKTIRRVLAPLRVVTLVISISWATISHSADLEASIAIMSDEISAQMADKNASKIAVVSFTDLNGYKSALGDFIAEELITNLVIRGNFDVVERRELDRILKEHEMYTEGIFDPTTIAELEKLLGIDSIVTGTITIMSDSVKVNSRAIGVKTGRIFAATSARIDKDRSVESLLNQNIANLAATSSSDSEGSAATFGAQRSDVYFKNSFLLLSPKSVALASDGHAVRIATEIRNLTNEPLLIGFVKQGPLYTSIVSNAGEKFSWNDINGIALVGTAERVRNDPSRYTAIETGSHAVAIWEFSVNKDTEIESRLFSISGELFRFHNNSSQRFSVGLTNIELH